MDAKIARLKKKFAYLYWFVVIDLVGFTGGALFLMYKHYPRPIPHEGWVLGLAAAAFLRIVLEIWFGHKTGQQIEEMENGALQEVTTTDA